MNYKLNLQPALYWYISFIFISALFSCTSYRFLDLQVLKPAEINYPNAIDKLFILNKQKIVINPSLRTDVKYYKIFLDNFNTELKKKLRESPLLENSEIIITRLPDMVNSYGSSNFDTRIKTTVCNLKSFDILDSVNNLYFGEYWLQSYRLIYKLNIQFYNLIMPDSNKNEFLVSDTIYWNSNPINYFWEHDSINVNKDAIYKELSTFAAESFANKIAPFWLTQERFLFYNPNKYMVNAYNLYSDNKIGEAIQQWNYVYSHGTKRLASKAAHNIAVSYETMDSLLLAEDWIKKSIAIKPDSFSVYYKKVLSKRLSENEIINSQLIQTKK